jgi:TPR repeat protein
MKKAVQHYLLSAEQNHPPALLALGRLHVKGVPGLIKNSATKALEYYQKAADFGNFHAMVNIVFTLYAAEKLGVKADYPTAAKYATLASHYATDKKTAAAAASFLGLFFYDYDGTVGLPSSVNVATHYLGLAVKYDASPFEAGFIEMHYSKCLVHQAENIYPFHLTGFNSFPRALFWLEKSANAGQPSAKSLLKEMKAREAGKCNACNATEASSGKKFLRCGRCKLYYYCSKKCQMNSWNAGHKVDCKSAYD